MVQDQVRDSFQAALQWWVLYADLYRDDHRFKEIADRLHDDFFANRPCAAPKPDLARAYVECPLMFDYDKWLAAFLKARGMRLLSASERLELSRLQAELERD